jgi:hypothetical protein
VKLPQLLTNQITVASSLAQLHDVIATYGSRLNHIHTTKLLTRASQLAAAIDTAAQPQQQQQQSSLQPELQHLQLLCTTLTAMMAQRARHATPDTLVAAVAATGRLTHLLSAANTQPTAAPQQQQQQQRQHLQVLAARAEELRSGLAISQLSALLWGFAKAGLHPSRSWLDAMLAAAMQAYEAAHTSQQQHQQQQQQQAQQPTPLPEQKQQQAGMASLQPQLRPRPVQPSQGARRQLQQPQQQQQQQQEGRRMLPRQHSLATDLALLMYAVAVMGQQPNQGWLVWWQGAVLQQLPATNPQDWSQMLWGLGVLQQNPGGGVWLEQLLLACSDKLDG